MKKTLFSFILLILAFQVNAQKFEEDKLDPADFEKLKVNVGADFTLQFQGLSHTADSALIPLGKNINLPTANLVIADALGHHE